MILKVLCKSLEYNFKLGIFVFFASFTLTLLDQIFSLNLIGPLLGG